MHPMGLRILQQRPSHGSEGSPPMDRKVALPTVTYASEVLSAAQIQPLGCTSHGIGPPIDDVGLGDGDQLTRWIWGLMVECAT
jgi:hypothetical protein